MSTVGDASEYVRMIAWEALGNMGEKAATNEVITKLVSALGDESNIVRLCVCKALGNIGEKAATNKVITKLMNMCDRDGLLSYSAAIAIDGILTSSDLIFGFGPKLISELCLWKSESECLKNISVDEVIRKFFETENTDWLSAVVSITYRKGAAVSITKDALLVYDNRDPLELLIPSWKLHQKLIKAFTIQAKRLHLSFEISSNGRNKLCCVT